MDLKSVTLCGILLEENANVCVSVHLVMSLWVVFTLGLREMKMLRIFAYKFYGDKYFNFSQINT